MSDICVWGVSEESRWKLREVFVTIIIVVDYAIDHSLFSDVCSRERKLGYSPVHCGELVW